MPTANPDATVTLPAGVPTGGEAGKRKLLSMILRSINAAACRKELADSLEDWLLFSVHQGARN